MRQAVGWVWEWRLTYWPPQWQCMPPNKVFFFFMGFRPWHAGKAEFPWGVDVQRAHNVK